MDVQPIIDGVAASFPHVAPYLALVPVAQLVLAPIEKMTRRKHRTWLNSILRAIVAAPFRAPALPPK
jgi:hypothetical protein